MQWIEGTTGMPITCASQWMTAAWTGVPVSSEPYASRGVSAMFATSSSVSEIMLTCVLTDWVHSWCIGASGSSVSGARTSGGAVVSSISGVVVTVWVGASCFKGEEGLRLSVELPELGDLMPGEEYLLLLKLLP